MLKIAILVNDAYHEESINLSQRLEINIVNSKDSTNEYSYFFQYLNDKLYLHNAKDLKERPILADFCSDKLLYRLKFGGGKSELIAKATSINKIQNPTIIDATTGLGKDSFIIASLGANVTMVERSNIVHALLENALILSKRYENISKITNKMKLINQDSYQYISNLKICPDVIYLDPMFPTRKKSASVKKAMLIFKDIVGDDQDSDKLLDVAIKMAKKRVVVKRPIDAKHLNDLRPDIIYKGKSNRFDVYTDKSHNH